MKFRVQWIQSALDDIATVWMKANSAMRADINAAANSLEDQLAKDPFAICESRDPGEWVASAIRWACWWRSMSACRSFGFWQFGVFVERR